MEKNKRDWSSRVHYLMVIIMVCATIASFFSFAKENSARIIRQNQQYALDAALQAAKRVEDMLDARSSTLNLLSITVAETIQEPWISTGFLKLLQETSVFDYVEFIDTTGLNHNADGITSDSTDRDNYLRGIQGETGFHVIYHSRITHETLVNFYAPVYYHDEIIGVLNGMFREESLRQAISVKLFDMDAKSIICTADGTVISSYGYSSAAENLLDVLTEEDGISEASLTEIQQACASRDIYYCTAQGAVKDFSVSLVPIGENWVLVQRFPSAVTRQMADSANRAGMKLELSLLSFFLIYIVYLIIVNLRKRRLLASEKVRLSGIVAGLVPLFTRLAIIEPEKQRYEYLKGTPPDLPAQGDLSLMNGQISSRYLSDEEGELYTSPPSLEEIRTALSGGVPFLQYEYRIRWDDEVRWENASVLILQQKEGAPQSLIFAIQDMTELHRQKSAVQQALQDAFRAAEDMSRAKSDFLARMSHNMRTPMNAILGMASIALSHPDDGAQVQDCLENISASGNQLLGLINEVLDMSKIESGGMVLSETRFDLADEIKPVLHEAGNAAEKKGLRMDTDIAAFAHRTVLGDPGRFRQVLKNLLDNAVKYTPAGGTVTFRAQELPSRALKSGYYEFIVEDTGIGIDPALQPRIFEPFVCGEFCRDDLGMGLGLSNAQTIVKLMSGDITVQSQPGCGSKFTVHVFFKLEEAAASCSEPTKKACKPCVARHTGIRVLLVDDIEINRLVIQKQLTTAGLQVETASDGAQAVDLVQKNPAAYYNAIFMDIQMPVMDGYEATRTIRASGREDLLCIPIIAVTANGFQEDVSKAMESGMNDLVMKPINLEKLLAVLDKWLTEDVLRQQQAMAEAAKTP